MPFSGNGKLTVCNEHGLSLERQRHIQFRTVSSESVHVFVLASYFSYSGCSRTELLTPHNR